MENRHPLKDLAATQSPDSREPFPSRGALSCGIALLTLALAVSCISCEGKSPQQPDAKVEQSAAGLVTPVRMGDAGAAGQLVNGFYAIENNAWRWTAGKFSVLLPAPPAARQSGASLTFAFSIPDGFIEKLGNVTLTGSVNGMTLKSTQYNKAGSYVFAAAVPASAVTGDSVRVDFALDKSIPPGVDKRQLGVMASSVSLGPS